jgi:hypothetical protein
MPLFGKSKQQKEIEREVKFKQGLTKARGYITKSQESQRRLWALGKRSLELGDRLQFENITKAYLRTGDVITRWERFLVTAETVAVQRGQVKATGDFISSMNALSDSMMAGASPEDVTKMQVGLETALTRAQTLDETLSAVMDATSETVFSGEGLSEESLKEVEGAMSGELRQEAGATGEEPRISAAMGRIEEEMHKDLTGA